MSSSDLCMLHVSLCHFLLGTINIFFCLTIKKKPHAMPKPISMVITHDKSCSMVIMYGHDNDCEVREVKTLFRRLHGQVLRRDNEDVMSWWASKKGLFIVKSFYSSLALCNARMFPSGMVWNPWAPNKVSFFAWEAIRGRILTLGQLKRSYFLPNRCHDLAAYFCSFWCPVGYALFN